MTGLIVSSNLVLNKRIDVILTMEGFTCLPVFSKDEVLNIFMKHKFDFVIIDNLTGDMDLGDLLPDLRAMNQRIPVITIEKIEEQMKFDEKNNIYHVSKTFIDQDLPEKIKKIVDRGYQPQ